MLRETGALGREATVVFCGRHSSSCGDEGAGAGLAGFGAGLALDEEREEEPLERLE